jgi:hypothetical protein
MAVIEGGTTGALQEVDATSKAGRVTLYDVSGNPIALTHREVLPSTQEGLLISGKNDQYGTMIRTDRKGNLITGNYIPELQEFFEGATLHAQRWTQSATTFVPAMTTLGGYVDNSTNLTTVSAVNILQSQRIFYKYPRVPMQVKRRFRHSMVSGSIADFGWGIPATTTLVVPNGTCFRMTNSGAVQGVITFNSVEIAIGNII